MAAMSHKDSKFSPFSLTLDNDAKTTGIKYVPSESMSERVSTPRPLLVAIHGGYCNAHHCDISPENTISFTADALSIPIVSLNRPGYKESTPLVIPDSNTYHRELGYWYHQYILPALWAEFGIPYGCSGIVLQAHSMGVPGVIIAASLFATDANSKYPLSGMILSGWGSQIIDEQTKRSKGILPTNELSPYQMLDWKEKIMLADIHSLHTADPSLLQYLEIQGSPIAAHEFDELALPLTDPKCWHSSWTRNAQQINVPIMFALGEHDNFWHGTLEHIREYETYFNKCPRFDGSLVRGAPHAIEWWKGARGWFARCAGFAVECVAWQEQVKRL